MALQIAELNGVAVTQPEDDHELRIEESLADIVEPAKAMALEKLGEGAQGLRIARA